MHPDLCSYSTLQLHSHTLKLVTIHLQANMTLFNNSKNSQLSRGYGKHHTGLALTRISNVDPMPKLTVRRADDAAEQRVAIKRDPNGEMFRLIRVENAELALENIILEGGFMQEAHDGGAIEAAGGSTHLALSSCLVIGKWVFVDESLIARTSLSSPLSLSLSLSPVHSPPSLAHKAGLAPQLTVGVAWAERFASL